METTSTSGSTTAISRERIPKGLRLRVERLLAGVEGMPDDAVVPMQGGSIAKAALVARLSEEVAKFQAVDAQLMALAVARKEVLASGAALVELLADLKDSLRVVHGRRNPVLAAFGLKPHADPRPLNSEERVARAVKARETRRMRHTMGVRQKAALKYTGPVEVVSSLVPQPQAAAPASPVTAESSVRFAPKHGPAG
jgi:hypothetical protein